MGLVLKYNKKDVSYHQAIWKLQNFNFMTFSDKFPKLNIYKVIDSDKDHLEDEQPDENDAQFKSDLDNLNLKVQDGNIEGST